MTGTLSLKEQAIYIFIGKVVALAVTFAIPIVLVRMLSQEEYGLYRQALMVVLTLSTILGFGFYNSLFYFHPLAKTNRARTELMSQTFFLIFLIGAIFLFVFILFKKPVLGLFDNTSFADIYISTAFIILFTLLSFGLQIIFVVEGKAKLAMLFEIINQAVRVACLLIAIIIFDSVNAALWGLVMHGFIGSLLLLIYLSKSYKISLLQVKKLNIINQLKYTFPMGLGTVVGIIGEQADKIILAALFTASDFAIYSIGNFRIPMIAMLYTSIGNVILPKLSFYSTSKENNQKALALWKKMVVKNAAVTIPTITFCLLLANPIITFLFGEQYIDSVNVFRITILIFLAQMLGHGYIVRGYSETKIIFIANLTKMLFSILVGYILIEQFGIIGAALSFVISFSINAGMQLVKGKQILGAKWRDFFPWKDLFIISALSIAASPLLFLLSQTGMHKAILIAAASSIYFLTISILLLKYKYYTLPSTATIKKYLKLSK